MGTKLVNLRVRGNSVVSLNNSQSTGWGYNPLV